MKNPEQTLLEHLLFYMFSVKIETKDILGIYTYGSRTYNTQNENSDLDYVVILSDYSELFSNRDSYIQYESNDLDLHLMSESHYKNLLKEEDVLSSQRESHHLLKDRGQ